MRNTIEIELLTGKLTQATDEAAGFDIYANESGSAKGKTNCIISTDLRIAIPKGYVGIIKSRSGLSFKAALEHGAGVIDSDYRGEIKVNLHNHSKNEFSFEKGDRVAQIIFFELPNVKIKKVDKFTDVNTERGINGFGSTGIK